MFAIYNANSRVVNSFLSQRKTTQITSDSVTLVVSGRAKYTQAQGVLESSLFQEYDCAEGAKFGINLTTLLECLQIFGPASLAQTSVSMAYQEVSSLRNMPLWVFCCGCRFFLKLLDATTRLKSIDRFPAVRRFLRHGDRFRFFITLGAGIDLQLIKHASAQNLPSSGS